MDEHPPYVDIIALAEFDDLRLRLGLASGIQLFMRILAQSEEVDLLMDQFERDAQRDYGVARVWYLLYLTEPHKHDIALAVYVYALDRADAPYMVCISKHRDLYWAKQVALDLLTR